MKTFGVTSLLFLLALSVVSAVVREGPLKHNLRTHDTARVIDAELAHLATLSDDTWPEHGPWIVEVEHGTHANVLEKAVKVGGKKVIAKDTWEDDADSFNGMALSGLKRSDLLAIPGVKRVHADLVVHTMVTWGQDRIDQPALPLADRYAPAYRGCGVDVYVIDTGIDTLHREFNNTGRVVQNIFNAYGSITANTDGDGHGTHCAGTIGGKSVGVSSCANIYGLKALDDTGSGSLSKIVSAVNAAKNAHRAKPNAKSVISMSIGYNCGTTCATDPLLAPINSAMAVGMVASVAAGNDNRNAYRDSPANIADAITVGATGQDDVRAYFSNYGPILDIFGPGVDIQSACSSRIICDANGLIFMSGTSMATPHVSGVVAQVLEANASPMKTIEHVRAVRNQMVANAVKTVKSAPTTTTKALLQVPKGSGIAVCFKETEGSNQVSGSRNACSGYSKVPAKTDVLVDNNDDRPGGLTLSWGLLANNLTAGTEYRLCFDELTGSVQCGNGLTSCTAFRSAGQATAFTAPFRTTSGGCQYTWWTEQRANATVLTSTSCKLVFKETEGTTQCLLNRGPSPCSWTNVTPATYTPAFQLATTSAAGGCTMQWGLQCH